MRIWNRFCWCATGFLFALTCIGLWHHDIDITSSAAFGGLIALLVACGMEYEL